MDKKRRPKPLDPRNVKWMTDQIRQCEEECDHITSEQFLPTRLVNVGAQDGDDARLVITAELIKTQGSGGNHGIKYATLSYCWGPEEDAKQQVKTTKDNIFLHLKVMPLTEMSPVVKDAILVCRAVGIQYIWIDALCILQGDLKDWDNESEIMGKVYYCSHLTICPLSSASCQEGFLGSRAPGVDIEFQSSRQPDIRGTYSIFECIDKAGSKYSGSILCKHLDEGQSLWTTRGWAFQESILSLRILFFGASMCHFFCESKEVSENGYFTNHFSQHCAGRYLIRPLPCIPDLALKRMEAYGGWNLTMDILRREWTYRDDFLPSLSGLAKEYAKVINDVYLAGLWKNNLQHDLTWGVNWPDPGDLDSILQRNRHRSPYVAPSWSWASQEKTVERSVYLSYHLPMGDVKRTPFKFSICGTSECHLRSEFTLKDFEMDPWGENLFGRLRGGFVKVSGKAVPFPSEVLIRNRTSSGRSEFGYFMNGLGTCKFDWTSQPNTVQEPGRMRLLPTSSCCASTSNWSDILWRANPEDDPERLHRTFMESNPLCRVLNSWVDSEDCRCCNDKELTRNAWGIIIHPADEPGSYYRVGIFLLPAYSGGSNLFKGIKNEIVKLI
jgi:hypothetical protein